MGRQAVARGAICSEWYRGGGVDEDKGYCGHGGCCWEGENLGISRSRIECPGFLDGSSSMWLFKLRKEMTATRWRKLPCVGC